MLFRCLEIRIICISFEEYSLIEYCLRLGRERLVSEGLGGFETALSMKISQSFSIKLIAFNHCILVSYMGTFSVFKQTLMYCNYLLL